MPDKNRLYQVSEEPALTAKVTLRQNGVEVEVSGTDIDAIMDAFDRLANWSDQYLGYAPTRKKRKE
jgi:hypothetical protein